MTRMSDIPPELLAEMTPAVRAFIESLLVQMAEMQARMQAEIDELKAQVKKLTPKNSSVPPSTQHPHARPPANPKSKSKKKRGGQNDCQGDWYECSVSPKTFRLPTSLRNFPTASMLIVLGSLRS